jgi:hypothetical protein
MQQPQQPGTALPGELAQEKSEDEESKIREKIRMNNIKLHGRNTEILTGAFGELRENEHKAPLDHFPPVGPLDAPDGHPLHDQFKGVEQQPDGNKQPGKKHHEETAEEEKQRKKKGPEDPRTPYKKTVPPGPFWNPQMPPVGSLAKSDGGAARALTMREAETNVKSAMKPIFLGRRPPDYDSVPWPSKIQRNEAHSNNLLHTRESSFSPNVFACAAGCLLPPMVFLYVTWALNFYKHYQYGLIAWLLALPGLFPCYLAFVARSNAARRGRHNPWHIFFMITLGLSWVVAAFFSEVNYWYFMHTFYDLHSMRAYNNIDPTEVSGMRVMDAASVGFIDGARVVTDMAMSYTTWDVYCVAPITTDAGLPSQGGKLASYDYWAIGVNCCNAGTTTGYHCGQYQNINARQGLRLIDNEQIKYFQLAVQQAEAAYGVSARHPVFLYWVQDPDAQMVSFFTQGLKNWIMACSVHFCLILLIVTCFVVAPRGAHQGIVKAVDDEEAHMKEDMTFN